MGDLEAEILECVWELGSASVKDVHECLLERREIAYTTVMTVMSRLAAKGLLISQPVGRAYVYEAAAGREDFSSAWSAISCPAWWPTSTGRCLRSS